jgi:hypothetical protein
MIKRYPPLLGKTLTELENVYSALCNNGFQKRDVTKIIETVPRVVSVNVKHHIEEAIFIFNLYNKLEQKDVVKIMNAFPYALLNKPKKMQEFAGQFKKYHLTPKQIKKLCSESGGLLGSKVSNFKGVYDTMRQFGISAKETTRILEMLPEMAL